MRVDTSLQQVNYFKLEIIMPSKWDKTDYLQIFLCGQSVTFPFQIIDQLDYDDNSWYK